MTPRPSSPESHETIQVGMQLTHLLTVTTVVSYGKCPGQKGYQRKNNEFPPEGYTLSLVPDLVS